MNTLLYKGINELKDREKTRRQEDDNTGTQVTNFFVVCVGGG